MAQKLTEYLEGKEAEGFNPRPHYSADGDFLTYFFREEEAYGRRVDQLLTIYLSVESDELVGCKIKGVHRILTTLGDFGVAIHGQSVTLGMLFLAGMAVSEDPTQREQYERIGQRTRDVRIDTSELQPA